MITYSIGPNDKYDSLPLLPTIDFTNCGIQHNSAITSIGSIDIGYLKINELDYGTNRVFIDHVATNSTVDITTLTSWHVTPNLLINQDVTRNPSDYYEKYEPLHIVKSGSGAVSNRTIGCAFASSARNYSRSKLSNIVIKNESNVIVWQYLTNISDYKTTPLNASFVNTPSRGKLGIDQNFETVEDFLSAITNPNSDISVEVTSKDINISDIPSSINGKSVKILLTYYDGNKYGKKPPYGSGRYKGRESVIDNTTYKTKKILMPESNIRIEGKPTIPYKEEIVSTLQSNNSRPTSTPNNFKW